MKQVLSISDSPQEKQHFNLDAEQALLGCLLLNNEVFTSLDFLKKEHFYISVHSMIFEEIYAGFCSGNTVNPVTLKTKFDTDERLADVGGAKYLARLAANAGFVINAKDYANVILALYHARTLQHACMATLEALESESKTVEEIASDLQGKCLETVSGKTENKIRDDYEVTEAILESLKSRKNALSTGLGKLDEAMGGGLYEGYSYGFAARKKVGKTMLAATLSVNLATQGIPHLFICGEMGAQRIHERNLARLMQVYPSKFRGNDRNNAEFLSDIAQVAIESKRCTYYMDAPNITFNALKRAVITAVMKKKIKVCILDYWQLVQGAQRGQNKAEFLDEVAQWIANSGREYNITNIVMAQINQEGNTRGGEGIRLAFDQVFQIHREDDTLPWVWFEMLDTRYTSWMNIGNKNTPGLKMNSKGPYFEEIDVQEA
jgi:replicative DNA helicase